MLKDLNICMIDEFTWMKKKRKNLKFKNNPPYSLTTIFRYLCILMIGLGIYYAKGGLDQNMKNKIFLIPAVILYLFTSYSYAEDFICTAATQNDIEVTNQITNNQKI